MSILKGCKGWCNIKVRELSLELSFNAVKALLLRLFLDFLCVSVWFTMEGTAARLYSSCFPFDVLKAFPSCQ